MRALQILQHMNIEQDIKTRFGMLPEKINDSTDIPTRRVKSLIECREKIPERSVANYKSSKGEFKRESDPI